MSQFLSRDDFLKIRPRRYRVVEIPEEFGGGKVRIQSLTARERGTYEAYFQVPDKATRQQRAAKAREQLLILCVVDEDGKRFLTSEDAARLAEQDVAFIEPIVNACMQLGAIGDDDLEALVKNSEQTSN